MRRSNLNRRLCTFLWIACWALPGTAAAQGSPEADRGASASQAATQREDPAALIEQGITLLTGPGSDEEALAAFLAAAERSDRPASAWLWAAVAAERLGRFEEAGAYKARALAPAPRLATSAPAPSAAAPSAAPPASAAEPPTPAPRVAPSPPPAAPAEEPASSPSSGVRAEAPAATDTPEGAKKAGEQTDAAEAAAAEAGAQSAGEEKPADAAEEKADTDKTEKVDAFQHFFGRREKPKPREEAEEPPPPPAG